MNEDTALHDEAAAHRVQLLNRRFALGKAPLAVVEMPSVACAPLESEVVCVLAILVVLVVGVSYRANALHGAHAGMQPHADGRNTHVDNAKFICLALVIWGHWIDAAHITPSASYKASWFHMPLFCMLSGAMSTKPLSQDRLARFVALTVGSFVLWVLVLEPAVTTLSWLLWGREGTFSWEQDYAMMTLGDALKHRYGDPFRTVFIGPGPEGVWYLRCLILWRMFAWCLDAVSFSGSVQMGIAFLIGVSAAYTQEAKQGSFSIVRVATLGPFFFAGRWLYWNNIANLAPKLRPATYLISWLVLTAFVCMYQTYELKLDKVFMAVETYPDPFISYRSLSAPNCTIDFAMLWFRYLMDLVLRLAMSVAFLHYCVPRGHIMFISNSGAHTLYPYLLHFSALRLGLGAAMGRFYTWAGGTQYPSGVASSLPMLVLFVASCALEFLLSSPYVRVLFRWALEPSWLLHGKDEKPSTSGGSTVDAIPQKLQ